VLSARREAPIGLMRVSKTGVPRTAILVSSVIGFLCVIAAAVSPDTVFLFLLNSSGAIILFVYLLIAVSQYVLRRRTPDARLQVKMWGFPVLTLLTIAAIVGVLISMGVGAETRSQLVLSLLAWALVLVAYFVRHKTIGAAHLTEQGVGAETQADRWMHEHGAAADVEVDAVVGEGPLDPALIRRMDEEGYPNEAP
jgi:GABA permease